MFCNESIIKEEFRGMSVVVSKWSIIAGPLKDFPDDKFDY